MSSKTGRHVKKSSSGEPATLYDAVAGRVGYEGFLTVKKSSKQRDTSNTAGAAVTPDEVLFRRRGAPLRYEENDIYYADRQLTQELPDSDLLKAIHAYVSDFYGSLSQDENRGENMDDNFRCFDETSLLALGILLEEAARKSVGENVDLAPTRAADDESAQQSTVTLETTGRLSQAAVDRRLRNRKRARS